ncbi:MAG: glycosyltransferase family 2 protein [Candidatus Paceibacterota bacterium]|jgi:glycosyltransferase involved in cell wall biosynthesis
MDKLSVIICTHIHQDRVLGLKKTILSLSKKENDIFLMEIIIVDNGSSLSEIEKKELLAISSKIIFIIENEIGLSVARNTGIKNSNGNIIAFTDDDVWVSKTWAKSILEIYKNSDVLCVGGKIKMTNMEIIKDKKWLTNYFLRFLFPTEFPKHTGKIIAPYFLVGANISFRKDVFEKHGLFNIKLGRIANKLLSCEDTEFIARLPKENIFFVNNAEVYGEIDKKRLSRKYMIKRLYWQGYSDFIFVQNVGINRFFDNYETIFGWNFLKFSFSKLFYLKFFEFICTIIRCIGFYISKKKNESK